jgi:hypothetical protein
LFWKGTLLVEHKSKGHDLDKAYQQALDYFPCLKDQDLPKYLLVSDFARFRLDDLEESTQHEFTLTKLPERTHLFGFISGYTKADLYDPNSMPKRLLNVHQALDAAVDACYRTTSFKTELERLEFLFALYRKYTEPLAHIAQKAAKKLRRR